MSLYGFWIKRQETNTDSLYIHNLTSICCCVYDNHIDKELALRCLPFKYNHLKEYVPFPSFWNLGKANTTITAHCGVGGVGGSFDTNRGQNMVNHTDLINTIVTLPLTTNWQENFWHYSRKPLRNGINNLCGNPFQFVFLIFYAFMWTCQIQYMVHNQCVSVINLRSSIWKNFQPLPFVC